MIARSLVVASALALLAGCAPVQKQKDYTRFIAAQPHAILVVPVVNRSMSVDAPDYVLSTLTIPVAERGYYVFPVNMVKRVLEDDGLADADLVHNAEPQKLAELFGADSVLYITIEKWEAKYVILSTSVTVQFSYVLKDGRSGETIWDHRQAMVYTPNNSSGGNPLAALLGAIITAAVTKAAPNYMPLAHQAHALAFAYPGPGFPAGPCHPQYEKDRPAVPAETH